MKAVCLWSQDGPEGSACRLPHGAQLACITPVPIGENRHFSAVVQPDTRDIDSIAKAVFRQARTRLVVARTAGIMRTTRRDDRPPPVSPTAGLTPVSTHFFRAVAVPQSIVAGVDNVTPDTDVRRIAFSISQAPAPSTVPMISPNKAGSPQTFPGPTVGSGASREHPPRATIRANAIAPLMI